MRLLLCFIAGLLFSSRLRLRRCGDSGCRGLRPQGHDVQAGRAGALPGRRRTAWLRRPRQHDGADQRAPPRLGPPAFGLGLHRRLPRFLRFARPGRAMSRPRPDGAAWEGARRRRGAREAVAAAAVRRRSGARLAPRLVERRLCRALGTAANRKPKDGLPDFHAAVAFYPGCRPSSNRPSAATGRAVCN